MSFIQNYFTELTAGFSFVTLIGLIFILKKVIKECTEAIAQIKAFVAKYKVFFMENEGKEDFDKLVKEVDEATETIADLLDKIKLKSYADKLRRVL